QDDRVQLEYGGRHAVAAAGTTAIGMGSDRPRANAATAGMGRSVALAARALRTRVAGDRTTGGRLAIGRRRPQEAAGDDGSRPHRSPAGRHDATPRARLEPQCAVARTSARGPGA